jgi:phosphatidylglycerol:prolipoprotein diacylglycerol transferase
MLQLMDLASQYAPLMQAIARIGCLLAGCCYGKLAPDLPWAITFTRPDGFAPLQLPLHPTQIYFGLASLCIFFIMVTVARVSTTKPGQLTCLYLILESLSRFTLDFWRGDRGPLHEIPLGSFARFILSTLQLYSAVFFTLCLVGLLIVSLSKRRSTT